MKKPLVNVFADFETYVSVNSPGEDFNYLTEGKEKNDVLRSYGFVHPWLLGYKVSGKHEKPVCTVLDHMPFIEDLQEIVKSGKKPVIWFHNAIYDLVSSLETYFKKIDPTLRYKIHTMGDGGAFIKGWITFPKFKLYRIPIMDTYLYTRQSLEKFGESKDDIKFRYKKGKIPYHMAELIVVEKLDLVFYTNTLTGKHENYPLSEIIKYCQRDIELLEIVYNEQIDIKKNMNMHLIAGTIPAKKMNTQGNHAKGILDVILACHKLKFDRDFRPLITKEEYEKQEKSCCGGFVSVNKKLKTYKCNQEEKIISLDVNSMYPFIMTKPMPYGTLLSEKPDGGEWMEWIELKPVNIRWKGKMSVLGTPPIPDSVNNALKTEEDKFAYLFLPKNIFEFLSKNTEGDWNPIKIWYQKTTPYLGAYMKKLYKKRLELKKSKNYNKEIDSYFKTPMNSVYGKLCQRSEPKRYTYEGGKCKEEDIENPNYYMRLGGVFVGWWGRYIIYSHIEKIMEEDWKFLYADTDSVKFAYPKKDFDKVKKIFNINNIELGAWKNEGEFDEFHTPVRKKYALINYKNPYESKFAVSGINGSLKFKEALMDGLSKDFKKTIFHIRTLFNSEKNVLLKHAKNISITTNTYHQKIILASDFEFNPGSKKNKCAFITFKDNKYTWHNERV